MTVTVHPGYANINGRQVYEETDRVLTVQAAHASLDRIDSVVLRLDLTLSALTIDLYVVEGTPAATPAAPALTRNASTWELGLANLFIARSTATISQERITDTRLDGERCGLVAAVIADTDTSAFYTQFAADLAAFKAGREADFDAWFATVQGALTQDAAGNLLTLYEELSACVDTNVANILANTDAVGVNTAAIDQNATEIAQKASVYEFTASLPSSGWIGTGPYSQTVSVAGILETDRPIVDVFVSTTDSYAVSQLENFDCIAARGKVTTGNGTVTVRCYEDKPSISLWLQLKVVR